MDTVLIVNGDISRILFDIRKTKHFHPLMATDRQQANPQRSGSVQFQPNDTGNAGFGLRGSSTSVQLSNFVMRASFVLSAMRPSFDITNGNGAPAAGGLLSAFPLGASTSGKVSIQSGSSNNSLRSAHGSANSSRISSSRMSSSRISSSRVGSSRISSSRVASNSKRVGGGGNVNKDEEGVSISLHSQVRVSPGNKTLSKLKEKSTDNSSGGGEAGLIPVHRIASLDETFQQKHQQQNHNPGLRHHGNGSSDVLVSASASGRNNPTEMAAMVFGQPFHNHTTPSGPSNTVGLNHDSNAGNKAYISSERFSQNSRMGTSTNRVTPWSPPDTMANATEDEMRAIEAGLEEDLLAAYHNQFIGEEEKVIRPVFVSNDLHNDMRVSALTKLNLRGVVRYFVSTKIKVGVGSSSSSNYSLNRSNSNIGTPSSQTQSSLNNTHEAPRSRVCSLLAISTAPRQGLASTEYELFDEIATAIEELYEEQRKAMLANAASNISLVTSLVSTLQKDVEAINKIRKQMAKDWRKVEKVLIPFARTSAQYNQTLATMLPKQLLPTPSDSKRESPSRELVPTSTRDSLFGNTLQQLTKLALPSVTEHTQGEAEGDSSPRDDNSDRSTLSQFKSLSVIITPNDSSTSGPMTPRSPAFMKMPVISEDRRMMMSAMMSKPGSFSPRSMKQGSSGNFQLASSSSKFTSDDIIERFPSTAVEMSGAGVMDGMYGNQCMYLAAPSIHQSASTDVDVGYSMSEKWTHSIRQSIHVQEDKDDTDDVVGWRRMSLTKQDLERFQSDSAIVSVSAKLDHKAPVINALETVMLTNSMPLPTAVTTRESRCSSMDNSTYYQNQSIEGSFMENSVTVLQSAEVSTLIPFAPQTIDGPTITEVDATRTAMIAANEHLQATLHEFSKDLTKFLEANRQLSIAIERTINVARGYLDPDKLHYANSCSYVTNKGMVTCFNDLLLTLEQRHYKSYLVNGGTSSKKTSVHGASSLYTGLSTQAPTAQNSSTSDKTVKHGNSLLLWNFSVHNILANCPHRTFYDHIAVFLENIIGLWSSFSWTTQITIDYEAEDVEMIEEDEEEEETTVGEDRVNGQQGIKESTNMGRRNSRQNRRHSSKTAIPPDVLNNLKKERAEKAAKAGTSINPASDKKHKFMCAMDGFIKITVQFPDKVVSQTGSRRREEFTAEGEGIPTEKEEFVKVQSEDVNMGNSDPTEVDEEQQDCRKKTREYPFQQIEPFLHLINSSLVHVNQASSAAAVVIDPNDPLLIPTDHDSSRTNDGKDEAYQIHVPCLVFLTKEAHQAYFYPNNANIQVNLSAVGQHHHHGSSKKKKHNSASSSRKSSSSKSSSSSNHGGSSKAKVEKHVKSLSRKDLIELGIRPSAHASLMASCLGLFSCFSRRPPLPGKSGMKSRQPSFFSLGSMTPSHSTASLHPDPHHEHQSSNQDVIQQTQTLEEAEDFVAKQKKDANKKHVLPPAVKDASKQNSTGVPSPTLGNVSDSGQKSFAEKFGIAPITIPVVSTTFSHGSTPTDSSFAARCLGRSPSHAAKSPSHGGRSPRNGRSPASIGRSPSHGRSPNNGGRSPASSNARSPKNNSKRLKPLYNAVPTQLSTTVQQLIH